MIVPLFKRELRSCLLPTAIVAAVTVLYAGVIIGMFDPELGESLALMRDAMPELFAAFGMADQGTTLLEFVVNYLHGFLLVVLPLVLAAVLVNPWWSAISSGAASPTCSRSPWAARGSCSRRRGSSSCASSSSQRC